MIQKLIIWRHSALAEQKLQEEESKHLEETKDQQKSQPKALTTPPETIDLSQSDDNTLIPLEDTPADATSCTAVHSTSIFDVQPATDRVQKEEEVEDIFSFFQVFTAAFQSFAHGANDTANAMYALTAAFTNFQVVHTLQFIFSGDLANPLMNRWLRYGR